MPGKYLNPDNPVQKRPFRSQVIAVFVDKMPEIQTTKARHLEGHRTEWERQPGFYEALETAQQNPGHAMLLVTYNDVSVSKSRQRMMAKLRVKGLESKGYSEQSGWTVRAVDNSVYVMYNGEPE